jgi:hypothetical protein
MTERQVARGDAEYPHRLDGIDGMPDTLWTHGAVSLDPDRAAKGVRLGQTLFAGWRWSRSLRAT